MRLHHFDLKLDFGAAIIALKGNSKDGVNRSFTSARRFLSLVS
jgi:hypothetical protein